MKNNFFNSFEKNDINIHDELLVSDDNKYIEVEFETWFDVDKKFGINTSDNEDAWVNLYAFYHPGEDKLCIEYHIDTGEVIYARAYVPTAEETKLFKDLIEEACMKQTQKSCMDFWFSNYAESADKIELICEPSGNKYQIRNIADDTILYIEQENDSKLKNHIGHKIELVCYGKEDNADCYSIECADCYEILFSTSYNEPIMDLQM